MTTNMAETNITGYVQRWHLRDPQRIAQTPTSTVYAAYQGDAKVALKLLTPVGIEDESGGAFALEHFGGRGAVRLLAHDDRAHLLEYAGDDELAHLVWRGDDLGAAAIIADVLNRLHHTPPTTPPPQLQTLRRRFRELFRRAAREIATGEASIYVRGARMADYLLATSQDECILHGDIHHHNIRWHPQRGWLAYDPKGLFGERTYDAANTLCNPAHAREQVTSEARLLAVTQVLADGMGIAVERLRMFVFAYACLSASWFGDDDSVDLGFEDAADVKQQILTVAHHAEKHCNFPA